MPTNIESPQVLTVLMIGTIVVLLLTFALGLRGWVKVAMRSERDSI